MVSIYFNMIILLFYQKMRVPLLMTLAMTIVEVRPKLTHINICHGNLTMLSFCLTIGPYQSHCHVTTMLICIQRKENMTSASVGTTLWTCVIVLAPHDSTCDTWST